MSRKETEALSCGRDFGFFGRGRVAGLGGLDKSFMFFKVLTTLRTVGWLRARLEFMIIIYPIIRSPIAAVILAAA